MPNEEINFEDENYETEERKCTLFEIEKMRGKFKEGFIKSKKQLDQVLKLDQHHKEDEIQKQISLQMQEKWR